MVFQSDGPLRITGNHLNGMSNRDVEGFFARRELSEIPEGIERFFPNLKGFDMFSSQLETISKKVLKFPNLRALFLGGNNLVSLDGDLFAFTRRLQLIAIQANSLQHIGHNLLTNLNLLHRVNLLDNPCISQQAFNRPQVLQLMTQLPISCPPVPPSPPIMTTTIPSSTTDSSEYCDKCEGRTIEIVTEMVAAYEARIAELEKQMREILSNPGSCLQSCIN